MRVFGHENEKCATAVRKDETRFLVDRGTTKYRDSSAQVLSSIYNNKPISPFDVINVINAFFHFCFFFFPFCLLDLGVELVISNTPRTVERNSCR